MRKYVAIILVISSFCTVVHTMLTKPCPFRIKASVALAEIESDIFVSELEYAKTEIGSAKSEYELADIQVFINDQLQKFSVFSKIADDSKKTLYYVPVTLVLEKIGSEVHMISPNEIHVANQSGLNCLLKLDENYVDCYMLENKNFSNSIEEVRRQIMFIDYMKIDNLVYMPLYVVSEFADLDVCYNDQITIYSTAYYEANYTIFRNIDSQIDLEVYINEKKIDSPVYKNRAYKTAPNNSGDFVLLMPALEALGARVSFVEPNTIIAQTDTLGPIEIKACASTDTVNSRITEFDDGYKGCYIVDGEIYIEFLGIVLATEGSVKQNDSYSMHVYTSDYERFDIPATLEDAYLYFDELFDTDTIEYIKNSTEDEVYEMHFGLGLWIRNNWIYPTSERIAKVFTEEGITHPDDMSHLIIWGYRNYLNNRALDIE